MVVDNSLQVFMELDTLVDEGYADKLTPVEEHGGHLVKRDDLYSAFGAMGGKARSCQYLCERALESGLTGLVTAGSKKSPQIQIVSFIANHYGVPFHAHCPQGELGQELEVAKSNGAEIIQHRAGYNNVIIKRARDDAEAMGYAEIPFGMECWEAVYQTALQVRSLLEPYKQGKFSRIIMPIGSGMSLSGVMWGMLYWGIDVPIVGVQVGGQYEKRLKIYAPASGVSLSTEKSSYDYHKYYENNQIGDLKLDPIYEAKCLDFIQEGDLLWVVGIRDGIIT
jgi:hypothetical protein